MRRMVLLVLNGLLVSLLVVVSAAPSAAAQTSSDQCSIVGTAGNDILNGTSQGDVICGLGGNDVVQGGNGDDVLIGGEGDDVLEGGNGTDVLDGGAGADTLVGGNGDDTLSGGTGADAVDGSHGADHVSGDAGNDTALGGNGDDIVDAGSGTDSVDGGNGADVCKSAESHMRCETVQPGDPEVAVVVTAPSPGALVFGEVLVAAGVSGPVTSVEFRVDGSTIGSDATEPFEVAWDTTSVADGSAQLVAVAAHGGGSATSAAVRLVIANDPGSGSGPDNLDGDLAVGRVTPGEWWMVSALNVLTPSVVPPRYRDPSVVDVTPALYELSMMFGALDATEQTQLRPLYQVRQGAAAQAVAAPSAFPGTDVAASTANPSECAETASVAFPWFNDPDVELSGAVVPNITLALADFVFSSLPAELWCVARFTDGTTPLIIYYKTDGPERPLGPDSADDDLDGYLAQIADNMYAAGNVYEGLGSSGAGFELKSQYLDGGTPISVVVNDAGRGFANPYWNPGFGHIVTVPNHDGVPGDPDLDTARHEMFHVYQYSYLSLWDVLGDWIGGTCPGWLPLVDCREGTSWWMELTANWADQQYVVDYRRTSPGDPNGPLDEDPTSYASSSPRFLDEPADRLVHFGRWFNKQQYGAWLLAEWIDEHGGLRGLPPGDHSGGVLQVFESLDLPGGRSAVDAIDDVLGTYGRSWESVLPEFWIASYLLAGDAVPGSGPSPYNFYPTNLSAEAASSLLTEWRAPLGGQGPTVGDDFLGGLGADARPGRQHQFTAAASGAPTTRLVHTGAGGSAFIDVRTEPGYSGQLRVGLEPADNVTGFFDLRLSVISYSSAGYPHVCVGLGTGGVYTVDPDVRLSIPVGPECPNATVVITHTYPKGHNTSDLFDQFYANLTVDYIDALPTGELGGTVFFDEDGNGVADGDDFGVRDVDVSVTRTDVPGPTTVVATDVDGMWGLGGLVPGTYEVTVDDATLPGLVAGTVDPDGLGSAHSATVTLSATDPTAAGLDFGYTGTGSVSGVVFHDVDDSGGGVLSGPDVGLSGVGVDVSWVVRGVAYEARAVTGPDGSWSLGGLPAGAVSVTVDRSSLPVTSGQWAPGYDTDGVASPDVVVVALSAGSSSYATAFSYVAVSGSWEVVVPAPFQTPWWTEVDAQDRLVVAGTDVFLGDTLVTRLASDGTVDSSFGVGGVRELDGRGLPLLSGDGIYVFGQRGNAGWVTRLTVDGDPDPGFTPVEFTYPGFALAEVKGLVEVGGELIAAVEYSGPGTRGFSLERVSTAGVALGAVSGPAGSSTAYGPAGRWFVEDLGVSSDGRLMIAGQYYPGASSAGGQGYAALADPSGLFSAGFGTGGVAMFTTGTVGDFDEVTGGWVITRDGLVKRLSPVGVTDPGFQDLSCASGSLDNAGWVDVNNAGTRIMGVCYQDGLVTLVDAVTGVDVAGFGTYDDDLGFGYYLPGWPQAEWLYAATLNDDAVYVVGTAGLNLWGVSRVAYS